MTRESEGKKRGEEREGVRGDAGVLLLIIYTNEK